MLCVVKWIVRFTSQPTTRPLSVWVDTARHTLSTYCFSTGSSRSSLTCFISSYSSSSSQKKMSFCFCCVDCPSTIISSPIRRVLMTSLISPDIWWTLVTSILSQFRIFVRVPRRISQCYRTCLVTHGQVILYHWPTCQTTSCNSWLQFWNGMSYVSIDGSILHFPPICIFFLSVLAFLGLSLAFRVCWRSLKIFSKAQFNFTCLFIV